MKSIGIVICNYNKKEYVIACIKSVLESIITDYDIFVIDNASNDGSAEAIPHEYGSLVTVIRNETNLGGSGGFNTGIRFVAAKGYQYVCCLDNDVLLDENALSCMKEFMEANPNVGMVGAKIYHMQNPAYIQQYGLTIDFTACQATTLYADVLDSDSIPEVIYCDTVAACVAMIPVSVIKKVGAMPEDNFIYWDDMEWGYRIKQEGYQVAAIASAKALHEMGANKERSDTFITYYMWRNRIHFFMKYTKSQDLEKMSLTMLSSVFFDLYEAMYRKEYYVNQTILMAFKDTVDGIRGKAQDDRIFRNDRSNSDFIEFFQKNPAISVLGDNEWLKSILNLFEIPVQIMGESEIETVKVTVCDAIMSVKNFVSGRTYVDKNLNIAVTEQDKEIIKNYDFSLEIFIYMNQRLFLEAAKAVRSLE